MTIQTHVVIEVAAESYDNIAKALIGTGLGHRVGLGPVDLSDIAITRGAPAGIGMTRPKPRPRTRSDYRYAA